MIDIVKNIEAIRKDRGLTQAQVGALLGMSQQSYSQYMNKNTDLPFSKIVRFAEIYNISIVNLIMYPKKYVEEGTCAPICEECKKKDEIIENLNEYIKLLKSK